MLAGAAALAVAGGHVGVLMRVLRMFAVTPPALVVAWSAGAMALTERVLLFHDRAPHGPAHAEFAGAGLGLLPGCVFLPHARRRLVLAHPASDPPARTAMLARRAAPDRCVLLDDGVRLDLRPGADLPANARVLTLDGRRRGGRVKQLAINALRAGAPDAAAVDRFLERHEVPIVEGDPLHVPVPRRGRRGPARPAGLRPARPSRCAGSAAPISGTSSWSCPRAPG